MSRSQRWQPPHPDPTRIPPTKTNALPRAKRCVWPDCGQRRYQDLAICIDHILTVLKAAGTPPRKDAPILLAAHDDAWQRARAEQARADEAAARYRATRRDQPGWIYYILTDDKVKIGYSSDITKRLRAYPPGSEILAVHPGTLALEKQIHSDFDAHRVAGREWFRPHDEILNHCARVRDEHGDPSRFAPKVRDPHSNPIVGGKRSNRRW